MIVVFVSVVKLVMIVKSGSEMIRVMSLGRISMLIGLRFMIVNVLIFLCIFMELILVVMVLLEWLVIMMVVSSILILWS